MSNSTSTREPGRTATGAVPASGVQRTLLALLASALGALPLCTLLSDRGWLVDVWLTMLVVLAPALLLRLRRPPGALQIWPGVVLLIPWLTARYVSAGALFGCIPTTRTWHHLTVLLDQLHDITQHGVAPVHSTVSIKLAICAMLGLLTALIDLIAVVGRHGGLAGVPLLIVYTVAGAVPHRPVSWLLFLGPAIGFLVLLGLDARDDRVRWGHRVARPGRALSQPAGALTGQRIAVLALLVAVVLPFATPANGTNLVSLIAHHGKHGDGIGATGGSISPFAALKGQLTRSAPKDLATVTIGKHGHVVTPFYLRENVLSVYTGKGWKAAPSHGRTEPVGEGLENEPGFGGTRAAPFTARISVLGLSGNPIVFALPTSVDQLDSAQWSEQDQLLVGTQVHSGQTYGETVSQPAPTRVELDNAPAVAADPAMAPWIQLPGSIPKTVRRLVHRLTVRAPSPYGRARAISDFFINPANGFQYSLQTKDGDSGNDLVDFLTNRVGFCQQYAAAMAVMLRLAKVPARVVLGYTHAPVNSKHRFTITTDDAHAWVEAYFGGIGWIAFDPTPMTGDPGAATANLSWAPHFIAPVPGASNTAQPSNPIQRHTKPAAPQHHRAAPGAGAGAGHTSPLGWLVPVLIVLAVVLLLLTPWFVRVRRRRRRLRAGHTDPDPLWAELSDTATDLGYVWSPTRTPRQVVRWLGDAAGDARGALATLAGAVEERRYAPGTDGGPAGRDLRRELAAVTAQLRSRRRAGLRIRAALLPASLRRVRKARR